MQKDSQNNTSIIQSLGNRLWEKQKYTSKDALVYKKENEVIIAPYLGQNLNTENAELRRKYWDYDHCLVCSLLLYESEDEQHGTGYTDGTTWICKECYDSIPVNERV